MLIPSGASSSGQTHAAARPPRGDDVRDRVGQVQLALRVVRVEPVERRPQRPGTRTRRSRSSARGSRAARGDASRSSTIASTVPSARAHDPTVRQRTRRLEGEDRHRRLPAARAGRRARAGARRRAAARRRRARARDPSKPASAAAPRRRRRRFRAAAPGPRRRRRPVGVAGVRGGDDDERVGAGLAGRLDHPVDDPPPEQRMQVLRRATSACACPGPPAITTAARSRDVLTDAMAGAPGFEPGIAGPKPAALPLGYAPPSTDCASGLGRSFAEQQDQRNHGEDAGDDQDERTDHERDDAEDDGERLRRRRRSRRAAGRCPTRARGRRTGRRR